jgi:hypothetical protein
VIGKWLRGKRILGIPLVGKRGAVMVEYSFLLAFVFVPISVGISAGGKRMIQEYRLTRGWVLKNTP